jgi:hypothetical protein
VPVPFSTEVQDSVPKVDNQVAVGEDLKFQRKWWRFEKGLWTVFCIILLCDLIGVFGEGPVSKRSRTTPDGTLILEYNRMMRSGTASQLLLRFGPNAVHDGKISVYVSDPVVKQLGAQRIAPQPATSTLGNDGVTYTFPAVNGPWDMQIELSPKVAGNHHFRIQVVGADPIDAETFIFP